MSLLDRFRKKAPQPQVGEPTPTPIAAPPLPGAAPVSAPSLAEAATDTSAMGALSASAALPESAQAATGEPGMRAYDEFGREVLIPMSQWRRDLLPQALEQAKDTPEALSALLLEALPTGAAEDLVPYAAHLQNIDTVPERGAAVHGLVLLAANRPAEAEDVLVTFLGQFGPSSAVLTHLARAQGAQNRLEEADATLWRALEANPNDEGAVGLYAARSREREGDFGWQSALERAATLPGAWLPLLWLGRSALEARNRTLAVGLYKQALERGGRPAPTLLLQSISGDLGQFGLRDDALRLARPAYEPELHGFAVASNLLRALVDNGEGAEAMGMLRELARQNRPEHAEGLRAWEVEIRRRDLQVQAQAQPPQPQLLRIEGPVWLPGGTPARQLYATTAPRRGTVLFLGSSVSLPEQLPPELAAVLPDTASRLSRALPLFLAENAYALLLLEAQTLVPWAEIAGFAMLHQPWPEEAAAAYARDAGARAAVTMHMEARPEGATVTLQVVPAASDAASPSGPMVPVDTETGTAELSLAPAMDRSMENDPQAGERAMADRPAQPNLDAPVLAEGRPGGIAQEDAAPFQSEPIHMEPIRVELTWPELHNAAVSLWPQLAISLVSLFGDTPQPPAPGRYTPPRGAELNVYLRLLEQLLAINCAMTSRHAPLLVSGERETLHQTFDLALRNPNSLPVRLMLGELLLRIRGLHPELLQEFVHPLRLLAERHPFPDPEVDQLLKAQQAAALNPA